MIAAGVLLVLVLLAGFAGVCWWAGTAGDSQAEKKIRELRKVTPYRSRPRAVDAGSRDVHGRLW